MIGSSLCSPNKVHNKVLCNKINTEFIMTKLVLLGTGTPNACPYNSGPSSAVIVNDRAYIVDFGPGVVRQCSKAYFNGVKELHPKNLNIAFCTHLHSDHTAGLPDLMLTPWTLEREKPLKLIGPKGLKDMADNITKAYSLDIDMRLNGDEPANISGYKTIVKDIDSSFKSGFVYEDENVKVEAFQVSHGKLQALAYKFYTADKTILISGDSKPLPIMIEKAKDVDILLHEVEYTKGLEDRNKDWQEYHKNVHTLSKDLGYICKCAKPKLLITYHRIYHIDVFSKDFDVLEEMKKRDQEIIQEIKDAGFDGNVVNGQDLDIY